MMVEYYAYENIDIAYFMNDSSLRTFYGINLLSENYCKRNVEFYDFYVRYLNQSFPSRKQSLLQHEIFSVLIVCMDLYSKGS